MTAAPPSAPAETSPTLAVDAHIMVCQEVFLRVLTCQARVEDLLRIAEQHSSVLQVHQADACGSCHLTPVETRVLRRPQRTGGNTAVQAGSGKRVGFDCVSFEVRLMMGAVCRSMCESISLSAAHVRSGAGCGGARCVGRRLRSVAGRQGRGLVIDVVSTNRQTIHLSTTILSWQRPQSSAPALPVHQHSHTTHL
jgi:hypothetical protein